MKNATIRTNTQYNSVEIIFTVKPDAATRERLKAARFRWNPSAGVWYGYTTEQQAAQIVEGTTIEETKTAKATEQKNKKQLASLWDRCDVSDLPKYGTDNKFKQKAYNARNLNGSSYDKEAAKIIRAHLRERFPECKFSVTSGGAGYLNSCYISIKSSPYAREYVKGIPEAINDRERWDHYENSPELNAILAYCEQLHNAFDADDGDYYGDYGAHHDLYGRAQIYYDYEQTPETEETRKICEAFRTAKTAHDAAEEARREEEWERQEEERAKARAEYEQRERENAQKVRNIENVVIVEELTGSEQIAVIDVLEPLGKESTIDEVRAYHEREFNEGREVNRTDAIISRKANFPITAKKEFFDFCGLLMYDFSFLANKGGTESVDVRVNDDNYLKLTAEQRSTLHAYAADCVGIYLDNILQFVIDPEGYNYARYALLIADNEQLQTEPAEEYRRRWRDLSEMLEPFYIPAPIAEQIQAADFQTGEEITILSLDEMTLIARAE